VLEQREAIVSALKQAGFAYISLDLEGFRSGSMNEVIGPQIEILKSKNPHA
jgi:uncharacterized protein